GVVARLSSGPSLVVLDNSEHVIAEVASMATALLRECAGLRVLVTSRAPLHTTSEHIVDLAPLPAPSADADALIIADNPAVSVFAHRAHAARATFELTA